MADETKELTLRLPPYLYERLVERAEDEERSIAATVRVALRLYLVGDAVTPPGSRRGGRFPT